jgi:hypothetical protein
MTGYPWDQGDALLASDLNEAIANAGTGVVNVKAHGATGDGTTNDTAAIQAAAAAIAAAGGGSLYFPAGTYAVNGATLLPSNTIVRGEGPATTMLALNAGWGSLGCFLTNQNYSATVITDHDITIEDMTFDYGSVGSLPGGGHQLEMIFVRNVIVRNCVFQCRGTHNNGTAFVGCSNTLTDGCSAYGFNNCAYDHWWGPRNARVVNCYAESASSAQMVNFNPELTTGSSAGLAGDGFVLANCTFVATGAAAIPVQIEPLATGTTVRNVTVVGNTFNNVYLSVRGASIGVTIANNVFDTVLGGSEVIKIYPWPGGPDPVDITITGNAIINPTTFFANLGVIRCYTDSATITGNVISGTFPAYAIDVDVHHPVMAGNSFTNTLHGTPFAAPGYFSTLSTWGATPPVSKPTVTGAKGGNAALGSLLTALASYGLVTDSTS